MRVAAAAGGDNQALAAYSTVVYDACQPDNNSELVAITDLAKHALPSLTCLEELRLSGTVIAQWLVVTCEATQAAGRFSLMWFGHVKDACSQRRQQDQGHF